MNGVKSNDLRILSHYCFIENGSNRQNSQLLGLKWIRKGSKWTQELVKVNRRDVNCWNLFWSFFRLGKLKYMTFSLGKICTYLSQYRWQEIKIGCRQNSPDYRVFETVCHVANRCLRYKQLFKAVSDPIESAFNHYWNPAMQGRFLLSLQHYRLPDAVGVELRFKDSKLPVECYQKLTKEEVAKIEVGLEYELVTEEIADTSVDDDDDDDTITVYHYHYPSPPYYSVRRENQKGLPRRFEL